MRFQGVALLLLLLLGGCLEFDAQEVAICYDAKADRIDLRVVYRGLFVESSSGGGKDPLEKAVTDLEQVKSSGCVLFWNNWPIRVDLTEAKPPLAALAAHVDVENGPLFTDPHGVLCGVQFVRIRDAKAFLQKVNTLLELAVQASAASPIDSYGPNHTLDDETREILTEFFRTGQRMLLVEPGRIELRLPCSDADHAWLKGQLEQRLLANMPGEVARRTAVAARRASGGDAMDTSVDLKAMQIEGHALKDGIRASPSFRFFWDNECSLVREQDLTRLAIGVKGASRLDIEKASEGLYHDAFLQHLRQKGEKIEDGLGDEELERRFAQFRGREAVLPPHLARVRNAGTPAPTKETTPVK